MGFQKVDEPKPGKNRFHIDISRPDVVAIRETLNLWAEGE
jgi:hypothetical protein